MGKEDALLTSPGRARAETSLLEGSRGDENCLLLEDEVLLCRPRGWLELRLSIPEVEVVANLAERIGNRRERLLPRMIISRIKAILVEGQHWRKDSAALLPSKGIPFRYNFSELYIL